MVRIPHLHPPHCPNLRELAALLSTPPAASGGSAAPIDLALSWIELCPQCREHLRTLEQYADEIGYPDFRIAIDERDRALELWHKVGALPSGELADTLVLNPRYVFWGFCHLLIQQSQKLAGTDPERAFELAEVATGLAALLDTRYYLHELVADQQARAWAVLGDARARCGDVTGADEDLQAALERLGRGTRTSAAKGEVLVLLARLRRTQQRWPEAEELLSAALRCFQLAGLPHCQGEVELRLGHLREATGDFQAAAAHLTTALGLLDPLQDPLLHAHCQEYLTLYLTAAGELEEAELRRKALLRLWRAPAASELRRGMSIGHCSGSTLRRTTGRPIHV